MSIRVVLVDDHPIVLHGLQQLFERHNEFEVVAVLRRRRQRLEAGARSHRMSWSSICACPAPSGLDVLRTMARST